mmetsp:Transcript_20164/g.24145  ORF Transcript_20164/g.24145 Transcript_20164/m.24145 type:complete len:268 (-) Transcript_20164:440-1243(-)
MYPAVTSHGRNDHGLFPSLPWIFYKLTLAPGGKTAPLANWGFLARRLSTLTLCFLAIPNILSPTFAVCDLPPPAGILSFRTNPATPIAPTATALRSPPAPPPPPALGCAGAFVFLAGAAFAGTAFADAAFGMTGADTSGMATLGIGAGAGGEAGAAAFLKDPEAGAGLAGAFSGASVGTSKTELGSAAGGITSGYFIDTAGYAVASSGGEGEAVVSALKLSTLPSVEVSTGGTSAEAAFSGDATALSSGPGTEISTCNWPVTPLLFM